MSEAAKRMQIGPPMSEGGAPEVVVIRDAPMLAQAVAARLVSRLVDAQAARGAASVVLTGGGIGTAVLAALAASPAREAIDWPHLEVWWGDERFLPAASEDRNESAARRALLDHVDVRPERVHPIAAADSCDSPEDAAAEYASVLRVAAAPEGYGEPVPRFDLLMLGIGPEGHVASIFPEAPAAYDERTVTAVHGCPKPPPTRVTLTFPALSAAREVWVLGSGAQKAQAVALTLSGAGPVQVPAAGVRGRSRTLLLLDEGAAGGLPRDLRRRASPGA